MSNERDDEDDRTPISRPPLPVNVPYVRALSSLTLQLAALNNNLAGLIHDFRVRRDPVDRGTLDKVRDAFATLRGIGAAGEADFAK